MTKILLHVETSPDDGTPVIITHRGKRLRVRLVTDRWNGAGHAYFKLIADDGNLYVIRHDLGENEWEMILMEGPAPGER